MGVHLVLDDFGTGYSSLSHLRRFSVDAVKIDRSFIAGIGEPGHDLSIVRAVLSMAQEMDIEVVAEGVETAEQADLLRELGCPLAQGFLFGRPERVAAGALPYVERSG
jgi:EAL domain-containing protein (putative c-di-GMP-specific phosphodiesterase class I)